MNSVMEELGTVLAYKSQELQIEKEITAPSTNNIMDVEDIVQQPENNASSNNDISSETIKSNITSKHKRRRIYNQKHKKMGPITSNGGAGGTGTNIKNYLYNIAYVKIITYNFQKQY